jgi:hypothetical protein
MKARSFKPQEVTGTIRKLAQYVLDTGHVYNSIDETTEILYIEKKERKLNTLNDSEYII